MSRCKGYPNASIDFGEAIWYKDHSLADELRALDEEVVLRTRYYQIAWWLSLIALLPFLIMLSIALKGN